jgi:3-methyl-2-oxobutanoate hydroxymethyltransferase
MAARAVTTEELRAMKARGDRIAALTAYDFLTARLLDDSGVDLILVGDSMGTVVHGRETTIAVTMDEMVYHCAMVSRAVRRALVVGDMPFLSYQVSEEDALRNAGRLLKEGGVAAVKVEGGAPVVPTVRRLADAGIAVMGHLGLTPQSIHKFGTYRARGTAPDEADRLAADAAALEAAGAFAIVLEKIPADLGLSVTRALSIPTVGIGAGAGCDGQILVTHDMLGLFTAFKPRFVRRYAALEGTMKDAFARYCADVKAGEFPGAAESY